MNLAYQGVFLLFSGEIKDPLVHCFPVQKKGNIRSPARYTLVYFASSLTY